MKTYTAYCRNCDAELETRNEEPFKEWLAQHVEHGPVDARADDFDDTPAAHWMKLECPVCEESFDPETQTVGDAFKFVKEHAPHQPTTRLGV